MSIIGILSSNFFASGVAQNPQTTQTTQSTQGNTSSKFQQVQAEFQQLGQDLQSGNLTAAQQDYATLSQNLPNSGQASAGQATTGQSASSLQQALTQLGQDLQAGNLQAAQQDYATVQQDAQQQQQQATQASGHHGHHHHRTETSSSSSSSSSSTSQQNNSITQVFSSLAQALQAGNLSGAQSAFATLQSDLQQIGGFLPAGSSGTTGLSGSSPFASSGSLNVSA